MVSYDQLIQFVMMLCAFATVIIMITKENSYLASN